MPDKGDSPDIGRFGPSGIRSRANKKAERRRKIGYQSQIVSAFNHFADLAQNNIWIRLIAGPVPNIAYRDAEQSIAGASRNSRVAWCLRGRFSSNCSGSLFAVWSFARAARRDGECLAHTKNPVTRRGVLSPGTAGSQARAALWPGGFFR
jgi:hypothetical protein